MNKHKKQAFTLVELIVVIIIIGILWTIAFIYLKWYSASARDTKRISDISNIKSSLELFSINTWKYPNPDNSYEATFSWTIIWSQWTIWDNVSKNLSRNLQKKPLDPLTEQEYTYSTTINQNEYELFTLLESENITLNNLTNKSYAEEQSFPKIYWTYNQIAVKTTKYIIPTPSIVNSELKTNSIIINNNSIKSQIITSWKNYIKNQQYSTWNLDISFNYYEIPSDWIIDKNILSNLILNTYSWSIDLKNSWIYKTIVSTTDSNQLIKLIEQTVLNKSSNSNINTNNNNNNINNNTGTILNCNLWNINWNTYTNISYSYNNLLNWETKTWTWTENITNWLNEYTADINCNNWILTISNEQKNLKLCDIDFYSTDNINCITVWIWYYSNSTSTTRTACTNKPTNSTYTSSWNWTNNCSYSCSQERVWTQCLIAKNCKQILLNNPGVSSWVKTIDPLNNWTWFNVYCDMTSDWGWWTLVARWVWWTSTNVTWLNTRRNELNKSSAANWPTWTTTFKLSDNEINIINSLSNNWEKLYRLMSDWTRNEKRFAWWQNYCHDSADNCLLESDIWWATHNDSYMWTYSDINLTTDFRKGTNSPTWYFDIRWWILDWVPTSNVYFWTFENTSSRWWALADWARAWCYWPTANCNFNMWVR